MLGDALCPTELSLVHLARSHVQLGNEFKGRDQTPHPQAGVDKIMVFVKISMHLCKFSIFHPLGPHPIRAFFSGWPGYQETTWG